jgi:uncharacterized phage protein gp47/JayE
MPYPVPTLESLRDQILADILEAALPGVGVLLPKSNLRYLAYALAGQALGEYDMISWASKQAVPYTCDGPFIDGWANFKGVYRKSATLASGTAQFTGTIGAVIPSGSVVQRGDGFQYVTTSVASFSGSTTTVSIQALSPGAQGNADSGISLSLTNPIPGVTSAGTASGALVGGTDMETDASLQARMLQAFANPPQGGSLTDHITWALACPGVTRAWAIGNLAGSGSVSVFPMMDVTEAAHNGFPQGTSGGATNETRIAPATGDLLTVANFIYPLRPATAIVYSVAPQAQPINMTIQYLDPNTTNIQTAIQAAISDLYLRIGTPLGMTLYPSDVNDAIAAVEGVQRFYYTGAPVTINVGFLPTPGAYVFSGP